MPLPGQDQAARDAEAHKAATIAQQAAEDLKWLMADKRGRRVMWRLLESAGIYRASFTGEPLSSAHREGERNQGLKLMDLLLKHAPDRYIEMQKEARKQ